MNSSTSLLTGQVEQWGKDKILYMCAEYAGMFLIYIYYIYIIYISYFQWGVGKVFVSVICSRFWLKLYWKCQGLKTVWQVHFFQGYGWSSQQKSGFEKRWDWPSHRSVQCCLHNLGVGEMDRSKIRFGKHFNGNWIGERGSGEGVKCVPVKGWKNPPKWLRFLSKRSLHLPSERLKGAFTPLVKGWFDVRS